jgi:protein KTI12
MVRWDSPLFTIAWSDESLPNEYIWEVITKGNIKPPNSGTLNVGLPEMPSKIASALN